MAWVAAAYLPARLLRVKVVHASCSVRSRPPRAPTRRHDSRAPAQQTPPVIVPALRHPRLKAFSASPTVIISVMGSTGETAKPQLS